MARKTKRRKARRHVSAPKRRRKRMSGAQPQVVGARRTRRKTRHKMHGAKRGRRRMGASGGGGSMWSEFFGYAVGTGVGLFAAEIGGRAAVNAMGGGPGPTAGIAAVKVGAGAGTFAIGYNMRNSFVKGIGVGFTGSAANDGFRALQGAGIVSGTEVVIRKIQDRGDNMRQLQPAASSSSSVNAIPVMGENHDDWHYANVVNG
jgi:hypothetical protein